VFFFVFFPVVIIKYWVGYHDVMDTQVLPIVLALVVAYISSGFASRKMEMMMGFETWNVAIARAVMVGGWVGG